MLRRDDHGVHTPRLVVGPVFHGHLRFAVRAQIRKRPVLADFGKALGKLVGEVDGGGHVILGFVGGVAEHHALIAGAARIHAHSDVARLFVDAGDHRAGIRVKTVERVIVADGLHYATDHLLEINVSLGGDFAGDNYQ